LDKELSCTLVDCRHNSSVQACSVRLLTTLENLENSGIFLILENSGKFEIYSENF